jgi:hypothetical protein
MKMTSPMTRIAKTTVNNSFISTVYIGYLDLLFETMVFGGKLDGVMDRCDTQEEALKMHERMVERVKKSYENKA